MTELLIDVGNSRIKWAQSRAGKLTGHGSAEHAGLVPAGLNQVKESLTRIIAANVAGEAYGQRLNDWAQRQWQLEVEFVAVNPDNGNIDIAYSDPARFGVDRWLALIAARALASADVVVIDAGTALTVDVLSAQGRHLGGIITPGLALMQQSLQQKTAEIQSGMSAQESVKPVILGTDTASGVASGCLYAVTGAIEHLLAKLEGQTSSSPSVIISGGAAEAVQTELTIESRHVPDLVLQGMQILKGVC